MIEKYKKLNVVAKSALWFVICSFLQKAISLLTTPIFTRLLSTDEYGQFSVYNSWLEIFTILVTFKLSEAVFNKTLVSDEVNKRHILAAFQVLSAFLWVLCFGIYICFSSDINKIVELPFEFMLIMFIEIFFENAIKLWSAYQRFNYKYKILIIVTLMMAILNPLIGVIAVLNTPNKVMARLMGVLASVLVVGIMVFLYNIRGVRKNELIKYWKYAFLFNLPLIPHYLSQVLLNQADRIMIKEIINPSAVALYSLAYTVGMLATMITMSINNAYVPWLYRALRDKKISLINKYNNFLLLIVAGVILCVCFWAPEAIQILGGEKYIEATSVVYPVACSVYFIFVYTLFANVELFYEKRKYVTIGTVISAILNIILNWVFIQRFGYVAAAYTTLFCYICYGVFHVFVANNILKYKNVGDKLEVIPAIFLGFILIMVSMFGQLLIDFLLIRLILFFFVFMLVIINRNCFITIFMELRK